MCCLHDPFELCYLQGRSFLHFLCLWVWFGLNRSYVFLNFSCQWMRFMHFGELRNVCRRAHLYWLSKRIFPQCFCFTYLLIKWSQTSVFSLQRHFQLFDLHDIPTCLLIMFARRLDSWSFNSYFSVLSKATKYCVQCTIPQCLICADGPTCTLCDQNYILDVNNASRSCFPCPPDEYSLNNQCLKCYLADLKCMSCYYLNSSINCTLCQSQWIPNPSTWLCIKC